VPFFDRFGIRNKGNGEHIRVAGVLVLSTAPMVAEHHSSIDKGDGFPKKELAANSLFQSWHISLTGAG